jgi:hypothetical protein
MATCKCVCGLGFSGDNCQNFLLIQWESVATAAATTSLLEVQSRRLLAEVTAAPVRTAFISWSLSDWAAGSTFERYDALGTAIAGSSIALTSSKGGVLVTLSDASTSPNVWKYSLKLSRGVNEWGKSRGFVTTDITEKVSPLEYDAGNNCYQGGFRPRDAAPVTKAKQLCASAYVNQPSAPGGTYPPVPMQTLAPTMPSILPIGKKEINEATAKVAEWVSTNIGSTASALGKTFPMAIKSDLSNSQVIGSAFQALILGPANTAVVSTRVPTLLPSALQSLTPTLAPTSVSAFNSLQPSIVPSAQPTRVPTLSPSIAPTSLPTLLGSSSSNTTSTGFDFLECKNHVFQSTDEPVCRLVLGYGTYLLVGAAVGILVLLIGTMWFLLRSCCGLCGGNKPQGPYGQTDKIVLFSFYGLFMLLILLGGAGGFAMVSMLPTRINATATAIDVGTL